MLKKDQIRLIIVFAIILVSALFVAFKDVNLGLDLRGGAHIVLQAHNADGSPVESDSVDRLITVLRNRIDQYGVVEPLIQREGRDRVIVDLPGVQDPQTALDLIGKTAQLEFRSVIATRGTQSYAPPVRKNYSSDAEYDAAFRRWNDQKTQRDEEIEKIREEYKDQEEVLVAPDEKGQIYILGKVYVTGNDLKNATAQQDNSNIGGFYRVELDFSGEGATLFETATEENINKPLAIVLDNVVISAPIVNAKISGGSAVITGRFSGQEARNLAIMLRAGALPVNVEILENRSVGATLGDDSIQDALKAGIIGMIMVFLFMILYYGLMGLSADLSLFVTILIQFALLMAFNATLTLPGIAGIILTVGMAVDSNILIFERIKEEHRAGKTPHAALASGFSKAFATILDSNLTTIIAAAALFYFGSGPIRGFALTLTFGIIATLISALWVNRIMLQVLVNANLLFRKSNKN